MSDICAPVTAVVWRLLVKEGDVVAVGDQVAILESMKMEIPVEAEAAGTVSAVHVAQGASVGVDAPIVSLA